MPLAESGGAHWAGVAQELRYMPWQEWQGVASQSLCVVAQSMVQHRWVVVDRTTGESMLTRRCGGYRNRSTYEIGNVGGWKRKARLVVRNNGAKDDLPAVNKQDKGA